MLKCVIHIEGTNEEEIQYTLEEVLRKIKEGNEFGKDSREDGINKYDFDISGEESDYIECPHPDCQSKVYYETEETPTKCDNCGRDL